MLRDYGIHGYITYFFIQKQPTKDITGWAAESRGQLGNNTLRGRAAILQDAVHAFGQRPLHGTVSQWEEHRGSGTEG